MDHSAELARLPPWCREIIAALLEAPPADVQARLGLGDNNIIWARRVAWKTLGDASPLMQVVANHKRGPKPGSRQRARVGVWVRLYTTPGPDGHVHVARFNSAGNGLTDSVAGHLHRVTELDVVATDHRHELTDRRA